MRTGLVITGAAMAVLGAGLVLTLFFLSTGPSTTTVTQFNDPGMAAHANQTWIVPGPAPEAGSVTLSWSATAPADVLLRPAISCTAPTGFCATGPAVLNWTSSLSGKGTVASASSPEYLLFVSNPGPGTLNFSSLVSVGYTTGTPVTVWSWWSIAIGGFALLILGGIALFLGLFLPGGIYGGPVPGPVAIRHPSLPPDEPEMDLDEEFHDPPPE